MPRSLSTQTLTPSHELVLSPLVLLLAFACSSELGDGDSGADAQGAGGGVDAAVGGAVGSGGAIATSGGSSGIGGQSASTGGIPNFGGSVGSGGSASGGGPDAGGDTSTGGSDGTGGSDYGTHATSLPVLYIQTQNDTERGGDGHEVVQQFVAGNQCSSRSTPYDGAMACQSGGTQVDPGCVNYDDCSVPTVWCSHSDPQYGGTGHGVPCFAMQSAGQFFKSLP